MATATKTRKDVAQEVTDKVIAALEAGTVPWHKPWASINGGMPRSMATGKRYQGINVFILGMTEYTSPWWGTFKQIDKLGGKVRKGEHGEVIVFYKKLLVDDKERQAAGDADAKKTIPMLRYFYVFNAEQCDGLGEKFYPQPVELNHHDRIQRCEDIVKDYVNRGPMFVHSDPNRACYVPAQDKVNVPPLEHFESAEEYYSVTFHEFTHSTGHDSRLARDGVKAGSFGAFGDAVYSNEELIAEMGAAMLCAMAEIDQTVTFANSAAYLDHWLKVLRGDKKLILKAAAAAQRAVDVIVPPEDDDETEGD